jgi:hypothetical protein
MAPAIRRAAALACRCAVLRHDNRLNRSVNRDRTRQASFKQFVERPATLCIPLLLATFALSRGSKTYSRDFFELRTDFWLSMYRLLLCGTLIYLLVYGSRALLVLRTDPGSRRIANLYLIASASGIIACMVRITTALIPPIQTPLGVGLVWLFACLCGAGFALTSARAWQGQAQVVSAVSAAPAAAIRLALSRLTVAPCRPAVR